MQELVKEVTLITQYGSTVVYRDGPGLASIIVYLRNDHFQFVVLGNSTKSNLYICSKGTSG